jgi:hypothetical protein
MLASWMLKTMPPTSPHWAYIARLREFYVFRELFPPPFLRA